MSDWIVVDERNLPEFEKEVELVSCNPNTGRQSSFFGYLSSISKKGPYFKKTDGGELMHITHWKNKTEYPEKIFDKIKKKF